MKPNFLKIAAMAVIIVFVVTGCGSSKKALKDSASSSQSTDEIEAQIALKKKQMELDKLNAEAEIQKKRQEMQMQDIENERQAKEQQKPKMLNGNKGIIIPCSEMLIDSVNVYISGMGVSQDNMDIKDANLRAIQAAKADIESRFIGTVKNAMSYYSKDVNMPSNKKFKESELEGGVKDVCRKVVDKYAFRVCGPEIQQEATGAFDAFAVYRMYIKDMKEQFANELEIRKVDFDRKKWNEAMDAELKEDFEQRKTEMESKGN